MLDQYTYVPQDDDLTQYSGYWLDTRLLRMELRSFDNIDTYSPYLGPYLAYI